MYLSQLLLNPKNRRVQRELAQPYELHRTIMSAFPPTLPANERVLFRLDQHVRTGQITLLVQSRYKPDWTALPAADYLAPLDPFDAAENPAVKSFDVRFTTGHRFQFRILGNPTVKRNGKRLGLYREEEQFRWLQRKASLGGFRLLQVRIGQGRALKGLVPREDRKHRLRLQTVRFDGILEVSDPERLRSSLFRGIGSAKGFGCGLLSLAPA
jgi:CRISPR system Cascade subunit CasE